MARTTTRNVRVSGPLAEFVARNVGEGGLCENISEYIRDLIRRDKERVEAQMFEDLKAELTRAFAAPVENYRTVTVEDVIERNRR
jgi:Arc/MetJ-type ribon-helix-helix transcriptional regulator